ncbi:SRPBCC domain-containing protein [Flavisolibacter sp. BT320]|nr:SRPBCC domain-containing protein [Flavisolibacter longurius]
MTTTETTLITVAATIQAPVQKVWTLWTDPTHIVNWNFAADDWHSPKAEADLQEGGRFNYRMESRDGSMGFDFSGTFTKVEENKELSFTIEDGRKVQVLFIPYGNETTVKETFEAEGTHPVEMQRQGWQAIMHNFKQYAEAPGTLNTMHFQTIIKAPVDTVYKTMLDQETYQQWTAVFNPSSRYEGSWEKGAKLLFVGEDKDGNSGGMVSRIKENIPARFVSIEHIGILKDGQEITSGPEVEAWAGSLENYTFTEEDGQTLVSVDVDTNKEFHAYFFETWPKALARLKELCEA